MSIAKADQKYLYFTHKMDCMHRVTQFCGADGTWSTGTLQFPAIWGALQVRANDISARTVQ